MPEQSTFSKIVALALPSLAIGAAALTGPPFNLLYGFLAGALVFLAAIAVFWVVPGVDVSELWRKQTGRERLLGSVIAVIIILLTIVVRY